ncbi:MAG: hypothetical protein DMG83_06635 [Acidobacteria bacterium]|nr:MAG: hypothetical protein DMG83_06635 [Acidobacteriota bacterium]
MSSCGQLQGLNTPLAIAVPANANWYAIHTRARHERAVEQRLHDQGMTTFLPVTAEVHRWSDRRKRIEIPLFACYVFIHSGLSPQEIDAVRRLIAQDIPWSFHPFLKVGQRVRVRGSALDGIEGIFLSRSGDSQLVISVDAVQRSLTVKISGYDIEVL